MTGQMTMAGVRVAAGYTQISMAEKMGVTRQTYAAWENGDRAMPIPALIAFCAITGFDRDSFSLPVISTKCSAKQEEE